MKIVKSRKVPFCCLLHEYYSIIKLFVIAVPFSPKQVNRSGLLISSKNLWESDASYLKDKCFILLLDVAVLTRLSNAAAFLRYMGVVVTRITECIEECAETNRKQVERGTEIDQLEQIN